VLQGADEEVAERIAHLRTLNESEFARGIAQIWNERQILLSGTRNSTQTHQHAEDPLNITILLSKASNRDLAEEFRSEVLLALNDIADDVEEAHGEFARVGGLEICVSLLNGDDSVGVKKDALLLLGTAIKSDNELQDLALNAGALSAIAPLLTSVNDQVAVKAVYALGALLRGGQKAQEAVVANHPTIIADLLFLMQRDCTRLKASNLVGDLLAETFMENALKLAGLCSVPRDSSNEYLEEHFTRVCSLMYV